MERSKDTEIRRMSILKSATSSLTPMSILGLSLEILKAQPDTPVSVARIFETADAIISRLPTIKEKITEMNLLSAEKAESWVIGNGCEVKDPETPVPPRAEGPGPEKMQPSSSDQAPEKTDPVNGNGKNGNNNDSVIVGLIEAVTKTGKGFKLNGEWYNITSKTQKSIEPVKGLSVHVKWWQGNSGRLVEVLKRA